MQTVDLVILDTLKRGCQSYIMPLLHYCVRIDDALAIALDAEIRPTPTLRVMVRQSLGDNEVQVVIGPVNMRN